jgi:predicted Zn-dependent peptidase
MPEENAQLLEDPLVLRKPSVPNIYLYLDMYTSELLEQNELDNLQLISTLLTETMYSRIFGTAREKGWVYAIGSGSVQLGSSTGWWLGAQVSKTNSQPLMRLIRDECMMLRNGEMSDEEFEAARKNMLGKTMRSGQTAQGLVAAYAKYYHSGEVINLNNWARSIKKMKKTDCIATFQKLCSSNIWGLGALGSVTNKPAKKLQSYVAEVFEEQT